MKRIAAAVLALLMTVGSLASCAQQPPAESTNSIASTAAATQTATTGTTAPTGTTAATYPAVEAKAVGITEVMPDNRTLVLGHGYDWVELFNAEDEDVPLDGYYLTDDETKPGLLPLAGLTIGAGEYLCVELGDDAPFQLSEVGETVYLTVGGAVISSVAFGASSGESFDAEGVCRWATPGYGNSEEGYRQYLEAQPQSDLIISEALPYNTSVLGKLGVYHDLVEVRNTSAASLSLEDYYLTNSFEAVKRYTFPKVTLAPGECFVVYCSGDASLGENHAAFKLQPGQTLFLAQKGVFTDCLTMPADLKADESFGRSGKLPVYLYEPSFGAENGEGHLTGIDAPTVDVAPGMYDEAIEVVLSGPGTIHYTLDGARPTARSKTYKDPIQIKGVTTIRAICEESGRTSAIMNYTYVVGAEHDLPVLVISMTAGDRSFLMQRIESKIEHEAVATLIEDGEVKFTVPMGIRLHGNDSRKGKKKNFQLRFRSEYGAGKLRYPLFDDRDIDEYDSLVLKGGSEDWKNAMMRDELSTLIANGTSALYTQAMKPVVLYLGGQYWGVHYLRERFSEHYVASHLGVSPESVDILFSNRAYVQVGDNSDFIALREYCQSHDMSKLENYLYLTERIDVTSLIDWYVVRSWCADNDYANIRRFRSDEHDGKWRWMFFDLDWSYMYTGVRPLSLILDDYGGDAILIQAVLASEAGRDAFLSRYAYMMRTALNEEHATKCIDEIVNAIESEMPRDRERWGASMAMWESQVNGIRNYVKDATRHSILIGNMTRYFDLTDAEVEYYFGDLLQE